MLGLKSGFEVKPVVIPWQCWPVLAKEGKEIPGLSTSADLRICFMLTENLRN